jgi:hypothetical protein
MWFSQKVSSYLAENTRKFRLCYQDQSVDALLEINRHFCGTHKTFCGQNAELLNFTAGGTYSYRWALNEYSQGWTNLLVAIS